MSEEEQELALMVAFKTIVMALERVTAEDRERIVRAAMILVGSPIRDGERHA